MGAAEADGDEGGGEGATEDEPPKLDLSWLERLKPRHLKPICEKKGLPTYGNSQALAKRLRADGDLSLAQLAALCGVVGIRFYGNKAAIARRIGIKLSSTATTPAPAAPPAATASQPAPASASASASAPELRAWCRQRYGNDWHSTDKTARLAEARAALAEAPRIATKLVPSSKRSLDEDGTSDPAKKRAKASMAGGSGDGSQQIKATLPPPAPPPYDEELDRRQAAAGEAEGEAVRANNASVVGAQQLLQQMASMREMLANMEAAAAGHVAEAEAAAAANAEAIALRKEVEALYVEKEKEIQANVRELESRLRKPGSSKAKKESAKEIEESQCMTRATYAKHLRSLLGKNAIDGQDVFHIIANSKGGADHPDNFLYALGQTFNRSIGDGYDHFNAFLAGREKTLKAIKVSRKYGNRKDPRGKAVKLYQPQHSQEDEVEADWLFAKGQKLMTAVRAAERAGQ